MSRKNMQLTPMHAAMRCIVLVLVLALVSSSSWAGGCTRPGWPASVTYAPGTAPDSGILYFGPNTIPLGVYAVPSFTITDNHIDIVVYAYDLCGIGVPPPEGPMEVPVLVIPPGDYMVSITINGVPHGPFPLTVAATAGAANGIPALAPSALMALGAALLALGLVSARRYQ